VERARRNLAGCPAEFGGIRVRELLGELGEWRAAIVGGETAAAVPVIAVVE
jgi:hypothetical protein